MNDELSILQNQNVVTLSARVIEELTRATLEFWWDKKQKTASIRWRSPAFGPRTTEFIPPYDFETLPTIQKALDALQYPGYPNPDVSPTFRIEEQEILAQHALWVGGRVPSNAREIVGLALYSALGPSAQRDLAAVRIMSIVLNLPFRYVLRFPQEAASLAALPWELLADENQNPLLFRLDNIVDSCERYIDLDAPLPIDKGAKKTLHLLALLPSYGIDASVRDAERAARLAIWEKLRDEKLITFDELYGPLTQMKLKQYLDKHGVPDVVHYFGHGSYQDKGVLFFDKNDNQPEPITPLQLRLTLKNARLIVLHACQSAQIGPSSGPLASIAPTLSAGGSSVVAMQFSIGTIVANTFIDVFYDELLRKGRSLQDAVAECRRSLVVIHGEQVGWYVPTLYIRSRDQQPVYLVANQA